MQPISDVLRMQNTRTENQNRSSVLALVSDLSAGFQNRVITAEDALKV
jgi:hypothetical protein